MQLEDFVLHLTPSMHQALKKAIELGKWPDGRRMTSDERDASMRAVILYEHDNLEESQRVGYMPAQCKLMKKSPETS